MHVGRGVLDPRMFIGTLKINEKFFTGLLDTGADVSVITQQQWPSHWPCHEAMTQLQGVGQANGLLQSSDLLQWKDEGGHEGEFQPYILDKLPINLRGRDVLSKMGVYLYSPDSAVIRQMSDQDPLPQAGLGPQGKGRSTPIIPQTRPPRIGIGYF